MNKRCYQDERVVGSAIPVNRRPPRKVSSWESWECNEKSKTKNLTLSVAVNFEGNRKTFNCKRTELLDKISNYFDLPISNIQLLEKTKGENEAIWQTTTPADVKDLVPLKVVFKEDSRKNNMNEAQRTDSPLCVEKSQEIITKLHQNSPLTGPQRITLIEMLQTQHQRPIKRTSSDRQETANKKIQVGRTQIGRTSVDTECQTDAVDQRELRKRMRLMYEKGSNDKNEIRLLMDETYSERRTWLFQELPKIVVFKESYPLLFSISEIKNELERILCDGKCLTFMNNIKKYTNIILDQTNHSDPLLIKTKKIAKEFCSQSDRQYVYNTGSLLLVSTHMEERRTFVYFQDEPRPPDNCPYILARSYTTEDVLRNKATYKIVAEKQSICVCKNFLEAMLCLMAVYFIFDIQYPTECYCTMTVYENLLLETAEDNLPDKVIQFLKMWKELCNM